MWYHQESNEGTDSVSIEEEASVVRVDDASCWLGSVIAASIWMLADVTVRAIASTGTPPAACAILYRIESLREASMSVTSSLAMMRRCTR